MNSLEVPGRAHSWYLQLVLVYLQGDSGGALTLAGQTGAAIQLGIVSFGTSLGCNKQFPSAYTRVPSYLKWISDKTDIAIES